MITRISLVKLRAELDRQQALELWLGPHADVVRALPEVEHYSIALAEGTRDPEQWDAVATLRFADRGQMQRALGDERVRHELARTRAPFLERVEVLVCHEHTVVGDGARP